MDEQLVTTLKAQRCARSLTQAELAELAGTSRKSINAIEMGHMVPSTVLALKLARALEVTVEALFSLAPESADA